jgi:hypothetical protein
MMYSKTKLLKIQRLRKKRDRLYHEFNTMPRRSSFSGLHVSGELDDVQQELDRLEVRKSKRYYTEIDI